MGPAVVYGMEVHRLWLSAIYHLSDMHLYYNMVSLLWKGRILEVRQLAALWLCDEAARM